jgi:hypothetical protein
MMKVRGATKGSLLFFLIAALVASGVFAGLPGEAEAAKNTIYNVEILNTESLYAVTDRTANNESPTVFVGSVNNGAPWATVTANEGITFQMEVGTKAKPESVKIGKKKVKALYWPVTVKKKSFSAPMARYDQIVEGEPGAPPDVYAMEMVTKMAKNAKGKLYITDTDVDVSHVQGKRRPKTRIGDGTVDPMGSLIIDISTVTTHSTMDEIAIKEKATTTWTTGTSSIVVKKSKGALEGMAFPEDDPSGVLPTPLEGEPLDFDAGTGTLVSTSASMNVKMTAGKMDTLRGQVWVMKITPAGGRLEVLPGSMSSAVLTLGDLPEGFEPLSLADIGMTPDQLAADLGLGDTQSVDYFGFVSAESPETFEMVDGFFSYPLSGWEQVSLDLELDDPEGFAEGIAIGISEGMTLKEYELLKELSDIGDKSVGIRVHVELEGEGILEGMGMVMDAVLVRRGAVMTSLSVSWLEGYDPIVSSEDLIQILDGRVAEVLAP